MSEIVEYELPGGRKVYIEADTDRRKGSCEAGVRDVLIVKAGKTFIEAVDSIGPFIETCVESLFGKSHPADEVELSFSFSLSGEIGFIAKTASEGCFSVTVRYKSDGKDKRSDSST